ncbi:MAG: hypothetical protein LBS35_08465 [Synergistaceae bacterium]|nr:hypothetical protein [Synergistaceae bacterium]
MIQSPVEDTIKTLATEKLLELEKYIKGDVISFYGPIISGFASHMKAIIQDLHDKKDTLFFILTTGGGSATEVERTVTVFRNFYNKVNFIVPDYAYSAGTILCMSGDEIYMDYFSVLGPIDPQIPNKDKNLVPAQGYLDKVNEFVEKSRNGIITDAEMIMLNKLDLADIRAYEQDKVLTVDLLVKWLVKYKFKPWEKHSDGREVTNAEKNETARCIAEKLGDNNIWKSHGRGINIETLREELRLKVIDFGADEKLSDLLKDYYQFIMDYIGKYQYPHFTHTRRYM